MFKDICIGEIFPLDRDRLMGVMGVLGQCPPFFSKKFSESIDTGNCAHSQLRGWKLNVLN